MKAISVILVLVTLATQGFSQTNNSIDLDADKCGTMPTENSNFQLKAGYGYNYSNLQDDIAIWENKDYVWVETIGSSVQNRNLYMLTITDSSFTPKKYRISIHARTHPNEVQSTYVTNEIIELLLSENEQMSELRKNCVFSIIPMINPDGVELEYNRENANMVNLESNWNAANPEKEVVSLIQTYDSLMNSTLPINIALNMHSTYDCERYFVFHDPFGSSSEYADMQKRFINYVRQEPLSEIATWNRFVSWKTSTPTQYPESWFWLNYHENVLALTYEDMNCTQANNFDITAKAIVSGVGKYLSIPSFSTEVDIVDATQAKITVKGNQIHIENNFETTRVKITNMQGVVIEEKEFSNQPFTINQSGIYIVSIETSTQVLQQKICITETR